MNIEQTQPEEKSVARVIARNTAFMLGGQIIMKILAFIFNIYMVRTLGDIQYGRYTAALAYIGIFAQFTDLGMSVYAVREMARIKENIAWMVPNIIALRVVLSSIAMILIPLSAWLVGHNSYMVLGIALASCGLLLFAFQGPLDAVMIAEERLDFASAFRLLNQLVFIAVGTILLLMGGGYIGLLIAWLAGILAMGLASHYVVRKILRIKFDRYNIKRWWSILHKSLPFAVTGLTAELVRRFDIVFMTFVLHEAAIGWYGVPINLILMMLIMAQSMGMSIYPTLVKEYDSGRGSIQKTVQNSIRYLLIVSLPMAVGGSILADQIIIILYDVEFVNSIVLMQILVWAMPFMFIAEILGRAISTMHLETLAAKLSFVVMTVSIIANIVLILKFGVIGAALTMVAMRFFRVFTAWVILGPKMVFENNIIPLLRVIMAGVAMGVVVWWMKGMAFIYQFGDIIGLLNLVAIGAIAYGIAIVLVGAVTRSELIYLYEAIQRRVTDYIS